jgi:hypothetical protein
MKNEVCMSIGERIKDYYNQAAMNDPLGPLGFKASMESLGLIAGTLGTGLGSVGGIAGAINTGVAGAGLGVMFGAAAGVALVLVPALGGHIGMRLGTRAYNYIMNKPNP